MKNVAAPPFLLTHPPHPRSRVLDLARGVGRGGARVLGGTSEKRVSASGRWGGCDLRAREFLGPKIRSDGSRLN